VPLGTLLLGLIANATGIRGASAATAALLLAYVVLAVLRFDSMRALDAESFDGTDTHAELTYQPTV
jgi:hypothetical protein